MENLFISNQDFDSYSLPNISKPSWKKANQDERESKQ